MRINYYNLLSLMLTNRTHKRGEYPSHLPTNTSPHSPTNSDGLPVAFFMTTTLKLIKVN